MNAVGPGGRSLLAGLLGQGVGPSLTPTLHEREGRRHGLKYVYKRVELGDGNLRPDYLRQLLAAAVHLGFDGLNVTHPVKQVMVELVDELDPQVVAIGALNTILIRDGITVGHNTDVTGFARALADGLPGASLEHVVLLGAGGGGAAVAHALLGLGVTRLDVVDPDESRSAGLIASLERAAETPGAGAAAEAGPAVRVEPVRPGDLEARLGTASGLINATPLGMAGHPGMPCPPSLLRPDLWVADIVYRPLVTEFLAQARQRGCRTMNGAGMAVHQAADTFELVTGLTPERAAMVRDFDAIVAPEVQDSPGNSTDERTL